jgi:transcriptional regulator with XRE-family HTH domain
MKMTKRDIAGYLGVDYKTLFNWEKNKPNLYKTVMKGLAFDEVVDFQKESYEKIKELQEKYNNSK